MAGRRCRQGARDHVRVYRIRRLQLGIALSQLHHFDGRELHRIAADAASDAPVGVDAVPLCRPRHPYSYNPPIIAGHRLGGHRRLGILELRVSPP